MHTVENFDKGGICCAKSAAATWSMEFPLLVEDPAGTFPLPTTSVDSNVEANGDNLVLFVGCPLNWLDAGGVVYNGVKVELCGTFNIARGGILPVDKATEGGLIEEGLV